MRSRLRIFANLLDALIISCSIAECPMWTCLRLALKSLGMVAMALTKPHVSNAESSSS